MSRDPVLPPRKKRWTKGAVQLGLFIRFADGSVVEATIDSASGTLAEQASKLFLAMCQKDASKAQATTEVTAEVTPP